MTKKITELEGRLDAAFKRVDSGRDSGHHFIMPWYGARDFECEFCNIKLDDSHELVCPKSPYK